MGRIRTAFKLALKVHAPQKRNTGEPYILHPIAVANIAASMKSYSDAMIYNKIIPYLHEFCDSVKYRKNLADILLTFKGQKMTLTVDSFTMTAEIGTTVISNEAYSRSNYCSDEICELANAMNQNFKPYRFNWEWGDDEMTGAKIINYSTVEELIRLLKWEICKLYHLPIQAEKALFLGETSDFPDDETFMQFILRVIDKWVAEEYLDINILYLHGFASSGNSGTAREIQETLPKCRVISPDLPIDPDKAVQLIQKTVAEEKIDIVIGTSMGGLFASLVHDIPRILVNPSFHVSRMMRNRLDKAESIVIPFFKTRKDGATEFTLTREQADRYFALGEQVFKSALADNQRTLGVFGMDDDVVDCKEEYLEHFDSIRYFKGGHRLDKSAVEEVIVPAILQMVINEKLR